MPDFSQRGNDGAFPDDFAVWRRGVTYTVRPELQSPLLRGHEYRINATVRRKIATNKEFTGYADLYQRCIGIVRARSARLGTSDEGKPLHTWIQWHAWWYGRVSDKYPGAGDDKIACSSVTVGLAYPKNGNPKPEGHSPPEPPELLKPGGAITEPAIVPTQRFDEAYVDFDFNGPSTANADNTLSYGEYVLSTHGINFEPFVQRAENLADDHGRSLSQDGHIEIIRREWLCIAESNLVVVMLYYRMRSEMRSGAALT